MIKMRLIYKKHGWSVQMKPAIAPWVIWKALKPAFDEMFRDTRQDGYLLFIATWKMDIAVPDELKNIINDYGNIAMLLEIRNSKYKCACTGDIYI